MSVIHCADRFADRGEPDWCREHEQDGSTLTHLGPAYLVGSSCEEGVAAAVRRLRIDQNGRAGRELVWLSTGCDSVLLTANEAQRFSLALTGVLAQVMASPLADYDPSEAAQAVETIRQRLGDSEGHA